MSTLVIRVVCGLLFAALVLGVVAHPPANLTQGLGMLLPAGFLLGYAIKGPRRSIIVRKKDPASPATVIEPPQH